MVKVRRPKATAIFEGLRRDEEVVVLSVISPWAWRIAPSSPLRICSATGSRYDASFMVRSGFLGSSGLLLQHLDEWAEGLLILGRQVVLLVLAVDRDEMAGRGQGGC
jgi:hypothetical protein